MKPKRNDFLVIGRTTEHLGVEFGTIMRRKQACPFCAVTASVASGFLPAQHQFICA